MTEPFDREKELLRAFYDAWRAWCADASNITERPLREIDEKLRAMEGE